MRPLLDWYNESAVLAFAMAASSADGQDPIDTTIRAMALSNQDCTPPAATRFIPFDPATKMAEALIGEQMRVIKGAPAAISAVAPMPPGASDALNAFTKAGYRTIAVAAGLPDRMELIGLVAFGDPPRADSRALLAELRSLGVKTLMITGDSAATAETIAHAIGLDGPICPQGNIPDRVTPADYAVYAGVFPEDKFRLVRAFQRSAHAVGMCGDGANDAPALRQAQMGIAVSTATNVAKSAAGIVLTEPGLSGIVTCIKEGHAGFQRVLTYTMSILVNKCATLLVLGAGLVMTGHTVLTPLLQALSMLTSDMVTMSRAADRARPSPYSNAGRVRNLTIAAIPLGVFKLSYCLSVLAVGWFVLHLSSGQMQTLTFLMLVLAGQANVHVLREHDHFWRSHPAKVMPLASATDVAIVSCLASLGILMASLPLAIVGSLYVTTAAFALVLDQVKVAAFARIRID